MFTSPDVLPIFALIPSDDPSRSTGVHLANAVATCAGCHSDVGETDLAGHKFLA